MTPSPAGHMRLLAPTENRTGQRERMPFCTFGLALLLFLILFDPGAPLARPVNGIPGAPEFTPKIVDDSTIQVPIFDRRLHYTGPVWFTITNFGSIGTGAGRVAQRDRDELRIRYSPSFEFPAGSRNEYLYQGGLWVGGIVGIDTLVSVSFSGGVADFEWISYDTITESSNNKSSIFFDPQARADQEYYAQYADTTILFGVDELENRPHRPLHLGVSQRSYGWADRFARQFVIVECWIKNIGTRAIDQLACGLYVDADVSNSTVESFSLVPQAADDVAGYLDRAANLQRSDIDDPINVGWVADNDGDPQGKSFAVNSPNGALGVRILRVPPGEGLSYNWWVPSGGALNYSWGPVRYARRMPSPRELGEPYGDRNRYYVMTNHEIDYPQMESGVEHIGQGWRERPRLASCDVADGDDARFLISAGPACDLLRPGDSVPFVYAICAGENMHTIPGRRFDCRYPDEYEQTMNGAGLALAATWASWIYDTPGFDTDGDGYRGEFHLINCDSVDTNGGGFGCDTLFYTGDLGPPPGPDGNCMPHAGAPDYVGPETPPCPQSGQDFTVESRPTEIIVRWSGRNTEVVRDPLSRRFDFEGYRLYVSRSNVSGQYTLISSWDREDFLRFTYDPDPPGRWIQERDPISLEKLRSMYGDDFNPLRYPTPSPYFCFRDTIIRDGREDIRCSYFEPVADNRANTYFDGGGLQHNVIQRIRDTSYVGELGDTLTFGYYEAHLTNLNPSEGLYVTVTAFDYGDPSIGLEPLESLPGHCYQFAYPVYSADVVADSALEVSVYPNPYKSRFEGHGGVLTSYYEQRYEAPEKQGIKGGLQHDERRIWFINLPAKATIRIYTLDGDLVREIDHPDPFLSTYPSMVGWDLITRNAQPVVSGIYIWRVESELGVQTGKLVIIL